MKIDFMKDCKKVRLGDICEITSCRRVHEKDWTDSGVPFYRAREIVALHEKKDIQPLYISEELYEKNTNLCGKIVKGDILVTGVGTIGVPYLVKENDRFYFKDGNILWIKNNNAFNGSYLYYLFSSSLIQNQIKNMAGIGTVGTYTIENAKKTIIPLPSLEIQQKIAEILSTQDKVIELKQKLIDQKKQQKKWLMQNLLTGKIRLKGFEGEWEKVRLGDVGKCYSGLTYSSNDTVNSNGLIVLRSSNIKDNKIDLSDNIYVKCDVTDKNKVRENDILICTNNGSSNLIGKCALITKEYSRFAFGAFMSVYRTEYSSFIFQCFQSFIIKKQISKNSVAIINRITSSDLKSFRVPFPPIEEQTAIAEILSAQDTEIELLEKQLEQEKLKKKALMQLLLIVK
ncbi:MAG: restriction endonuclease subunit S [Ruminococcus sp.]|nr:restriction endonuclease subunit S [Ruminococcus sp.]